MGQTVIITGAGGELGSSLIRHLQQFSDINIIAIDLSAPPAEIPANGERNLTWCQGDVTDAAFLNQIVERFSPRPSSPLSSHPSSSPSADTQTTPAISTFFHFASILSTGCEKNPARAHSVNVVGGYNILEAARQSSLLSGSTVKVIFPSTIAVYGVPTASENHNNISSDTYSDTSRKNSSEPSNANISAVRSPSPLAGQLTEDQCLNPITMYGVTKLHLERLGSYFSNNFGMLIDPSQRGSVDFRSLRYPGLLCGKTVPTGGTSDYGAEMLHAAAQNKPYSCFVRPDTRLPFMTMPDALRALLGLWRADRQQLTRTVYNVNGFIASAAELRDEVLNHFADAHIDYNITPGRQQIVDSWPAAIDDTAARQDWDWAPKYDLSSAFAEYLVPEVTDFYRKNQF